MHLIEMILTAYGLCFALMNDKAALVTSPLRKLPLFKDDAGLTFFDRMLRCPYCTGFHAGWLTWIGYNWQSFPTEPVLGLLVGAILFALASSASCYLIDTAAQKLEG